MIDTRILLFELVRAGLCAWLRLSTTN